MLSNLFRNETLASLRKVDFPKNFMFRALSLSLAFALTDGAGIGMLLPILVFVENENSGHAASNDALIETMSEIAEFTGLPLNLLTLVAIAMAPLLIRQVLYYYRAVVTTRGEFFYQLQLRERTVATFMGAGLPFFIHAAHGESLAKIIEYANNSSVLLRSIVELIEIIFFLFVYGLILLFISPLLTSIAVPCLAIAGLMARANLKRGYVSGQTIGEKSQALNNLIMEALSGIRMIKMRGIEDVTIKKIRVFMNPD